MERIDLLKKGVNRTVDDRLVYAVEMLTIKKQSIVKTEDDVFDQIRNEKKLEGEVPPKVVLEYLEEKFQISTEDFLSLTIIMQYSSPYLTIWKRYGMQNT